MIIDQPAEGECYNLFYTLLPRLAEGAFFYAPIKKQEVKLKMASETILQSKKEAVNELSAKLKEAKSAVLVDYIGINVADDTKLRRDLREAGVTYSVVKNSILHFAAKDAGYEGIDEFLSGSTAIATCEDEIAAAKVLGKFSRESTSNYTIKCGFMDGKLMSADEVMALSKIPGKEALLTGIACALNMPIKGVVLALKAVADKGNAGEETA